MVNNDQRETRLRNLLPKIFPFIIGLKKGKPSSSVLIRLLNSPMNVLLTNAGRQLWAWTK